MEEKKEFREAALDRYSRYKSNFFIRLIIVGISILTILIYFLAPFSKVESIKLNGNYYLNEDQIIDIMMLEKKTYLFDVDKDKEYELLNNHPLIKESKIDLSLFSFNVDIVEISPCVKDSEFIYLKDGTIFDNALINHSEITLEIIENLPLILQDNESYYSNHDDKRYILYELALLFSSKTQLNLDYVDFEEKDNNSYFNFYFEVNDEYKDKVLSGKEGYIKFMFDASCISSYNKDDALYLVVDEFNKNYNDLFINQKMENGTVIEKNIETINKTLTYKEVFVYFEKSLNQMTISI